MSSTTYIRKAVLEETVKVNNTSLKDFNWQIKLVMASDKLANIKEPLLNVIFELQNAEGKKTKSVEMNKSELKMFIDALENANKTVLQLRS